MTATCAASVPLVSVVMSVYNGERYLQDALESLLQQSFRDFELIIVDDGSSDSTWAILSHYAAQDARIRLIRNDTNRGFTKALNRGLRSARGKYIARQDADDISFPERLATQVAYLERNKHIGLLGSAIQLLTQHGEPHRTVVLGQEDNFIRWQLLFDCEFSHSAVMFRRDLLIDYAPYHCWAKGASDYDLWVRLMKRTKGANLATPLIGYREHEAQMNRVERETLTSKAADISVKELQELLPEQTPDEVRELRRWFLTGAWPACFAGEEVKCYRRFVQLMHRFREKEQVDPRQYQYISVIALDRLLSSFSLKQTWKVLTSRVLFEYELRDYIATLKHLAVRPFRYVLIQRSQQAR